MELLKRMIEGFDEQKAIETITEKDHWQEIIRAEQNKLVVQEEVEGIETHFGAPCAIVYFGVVKGVIPVHEFGINKKDYVNDQEDLKDEIKLKKSYQFLRSMSGQKVAFFIKGHDKENNIFIASRKEALEWMKKRTLDELSSGSKTIAVIRNVNPRRAIADIGGIPAILTAAEYRHGWTDDLTEHIQVGDHITVQFVSFDEEKGQATISRKALIPDPWENLELLERSEYTGEIMGIRENGCYFRVKSQNGYIDGFLRHPRHDVLNKGDKILVKILNIDKGKRRVFGLYLRSLKVS